MVASFSTHLKLCMCGSTNIVRLQIAFRGVNEAADTWHEVPYFYIPRSAFAKEVLVTNATNDSMADIGKLVVGTKTNDRVIVFSPSLQGALSDLVRIEYSSLGLSRLS